MSEEKFENLHPLVEYIQSLFEQAKSAKQKIENRLIENLYYYRCEYLPDKLVKIREVGGSEIFVPLANIKARALKAWLTDIFFPETGEPPFDIEPTPIPELPEDVMLEFQEKLRRDISEILLKSNQVYELSGGQFDPTVIAERLPSLIEKEKEKIQNEMYEYAKKLAEREKKRIYDQLLEGGFFDALNELLTDIAIFPTAFLKTCVPRRVRAFDKSLQPTYKVIPTFNRVSPFDIYPSPTASDFSDWVIEVLHLTPQDLASLKDVEGFDEVAIDTVLGLYADTGYSVNEAIRSKRFQLEGKSDLYYNLIDVIEFWGSVKGELLKDYIDDVEDNEYYDVAVWICDNYVLKAQLNPDPLGMKPYCKVSFIDIPGSFWGYSLIDVVKDIQDGVNALARAIINNAALSSGPMIERNIDRIPKDEPKAIVPWAIFDSHDLGMSTPAYRFYQPQLTANALIQVLMYYIKLADEMSGVPPYAHSLVSAGGAVRTASGLSMLMESSARGIKEVVKSIDAGIIEPTVKRQYFYNLINFYGTTDKVPDLNIKAKGSVTLMNRMAQVSKVLQLLQITNNPVDLKLVGLETRRQLLENVFAGFGVNVSLEPALDEIIQQLQEQLQMQAPKAGQAAPNKGKRMKEEPVQLANQLQADIMEEEPPQEGGF